MRVPKLKSPRGWSSLKEEVVKVMNRGRLVVILALARFFFAKL